MNIITKGLNVVALVAKENKFIKPAITKVIFHTVVAVFNILYMCFTIIAPHKQNCCAVIISNGIPNHIRLCIRIIGTSLLCWHNFEHNR